MAELYGFIVAMDEIWELPVEPLYRQRIDERYEIWYYDSDAVPPLSFETYSYESIPKCYGLTNMISLETSGILRLQNQPALSLKGQGIFVAVIDTGIRYQDAAFRNQGGSSRIFAMWDQSAEGETNVKQGEPLSELVLYGRTYQKSDINLALQSENPLQIVPEQDDNGHGTFLASVAAGSPDIVSDFTGAAPEAELIVVKLRQAEPKLREFFAVPKDTTAFAENDIMAGIAYAQQIAAEQNRPLVVFLGVGTNHGSHTGTSPLCSYMNTIATLRHRAVVNPTGNEGNRRHHFEGTLTSMISPAKVEINVEADMPGLWVELWALAPEQAAVAVQSPTGELEPKSTPVGGVRGDYQFLFEGTRLSIDYRNVGRNRRDLLIYLRFTNIKKGIWTIRVYPQNMVNGTFHAWLPMQQMMPSEVFFLESSPNTTLTSPADALIPMSVGGYNAANGALYFESGRGPNANGQIKPDFIAPAVELTGKGLRDNYVTMSGTSGAAAITAGACAQILEWAVIKQNAIGINSVDIKNLLSRGARREPDNEYPSGRMGYGMLDVYTAFDLLRR